METKEQMTLGNVCGGAVEERFQRELTAIIENIADLNTPAEEKRKITIDFTLSPFKDRSGAQISFTCKSKPAAGETVDGTMFLQRSGLTFVAVAHDPRQARLFDPQTGEQHKDVQ